MARWSESVGFHRDSTRLTPPLSPPGRAMWRSRPGQMSLFGGQGSFYFYFMQCGGLELHAAKPHSATSTTSSGFRVPYLYLWLPTSELHFSTTDRDATHLSSLLSSNVQAMFFLCFHSCILERSKYPARGGFTRRICSRPVLTSLWQETPRYSAPGHS